MPTAITWTVFLWAALGGTCAAASPAEQAGTVDNNFGATFVRVSPRDPRYFELSDGRPYIPIGLNMIAPPGETLAGMEEWVKALSANGGNFIRIWLGSPFFDVEHERSGEYDPKKAERIDELLRLAARHGVRVKMCLESFRHFGTRSQAWSSKPLHALDQGGPAKDIADFFDGPRSRAQFKGKLAWYALRYGNLPSVFGWELWNEIDAVAGGDYMAWTEFMLPELHTLFPSNLCMQSLGSFDTARKRDVYRRLALMPGNDVAQVHRYLDLGASLDECKGPIDLMAAEAVRELLKWQPRVPVLLAESGAVEPRHTGPFKLYTRDSAGIILHDVLFAPFFAGAAGPGHIWHWDHYVARERLWHQFNRFAEAVRDLDPPAEHFQPRMLPHPRLRVYALQGPRTWLLWCRDTLSTWETELAQGQPPSPVEEAVLELGESAKEWRAPQIRIYDPWKNQWSAARAEAGQLRLPPFTRSVVAKILLSPPPVTTQ